VSEEPVTLPIACTNTRIAIASIEQSQVLVADALRDHASLFGHTVPTGYMGLLSSQCAVVQALAVTKDRLFGAQMAVGQVYKPLVALERELSPRPTTEAPAPDPFPILRWMVSPSEDAAPEAVCMTEELARRVAKLLTEDTGQPYEVYRVG